MSINEQIKLSASDMAIIKDALNMYLYSSTAIGKMTGKHEYAKRVSRTDSWVDTLIHNYCDEDGHLLIQVGEVEQGLPEDEKARIKRMLEQVSNSMSEMGSAIALVESAKDEIEDAFDNIAADLWGV